MQKSAGRVEKSKGCVKIKHFFPTINFRSNCKQTFKKCKKQKAFWFLPRIYLISFTSLNKRPWAGLKASPEAGLATKVSTCLDFFYDKSVTKFSVSLKNIQIQGKTPLRISYMQTQYELPGPPAMKRSIILRPIIAETGPLKDTFGFGELRCQKVSNKQVST